MADPKPKKTTKDGLPFGRPNTYKSEFCERVIELGREGKSYAQIARDLDVSKDTLYRWMDLHTDFSDAMLKARHMAEAWFEDQMQNGLWAKEFNGVLWGKAVSARFRDSYGEKTAIEHSGQIDSKVSILDFSNAE